MKNYKKITSILLIFAMLIGVTGCSTNKIKSSYENKDEKIILTDLAGIDYQMFSDNYAVIPVGENEMSVNCSKVGSALAVSNDSKDVITAYNVHDRIYPASMTKLMTGIIVAEALESGKINLSDQIILTHDIELSAGAAKLCLYKGDIISVDTLLHAFLIRSLNDCGVVLAEEIAGSEKKFAEMMNEKAQEIGATNSHFVNCHGLHDDNHYTTAYDLYLILDEFSKHELLEEIDTMNSYTIRYRKYDKDEHRYNDIAFTVEATNGFVNGKYELPDGMKMKSWKTGTTSQAGSCLIMQVEDKNGETFTVMGAGAEKPEDLYQTLLSMLFIL